MVSCLVPVCVLSLSFIVPGVNPSAVGIRHESSQWVSASELRNLLTSQSALYSASGPLGAQKNDSSVIAWHLDADNPDEPPLHQGNEKFGSGSGEYHADMSPPNQLVDGVIAAPDVFGDLPTQEFLNQLVIGVKTGVETWQARLPHVFNSWAKNVKDVVILGEAEMVEQAKLKFQRDAADAVLSEGLPLHHLNAHKHEKTNNVVQRDNHTDIIPDENSKGKAMDNAKFFGGLKYLREKYPNKLLYMLVDDDTFVFLDWLNFVLARIGVSPGPRYFGNGFKFWGSGCERGADISMAHGGAGVIVTGEAIDLIKDDFAKCNSRYGRCWMGDARLSMCLADKNVYIEALPNMKKGSIVHDWMPSVFRGTKKHGLKLCDVPLTFHHMNPLQFELTERLQKISPSKAAGCKMMTIGDVLMMRIALNIESHSFSDDGQLDAVNNERTWQDGSLSLPCVCIPAVKGTRIRPFEKGISRASIASLKEKIGEDLVEALSQTEFDIDEHRGGPMSQSQIPPPYMPGRKPPMRREADRGFGGGRMGGGRPPWWGRPDYHGWNGWMNDRPHRLRPDHIPRPRGGRPDLFGHDRWGNMSWAHGFPDHEMSFPRPHTPLWEMEEHRLKHLRFDPWSKDRNPFQNGSFWKRTRPHPLDGHRFIEDNHGALDHEAEQEIWSREKEHMWPNHRPDHGGSHRYPGATAPFGPHGPHGPRWRGDGPEGVQGPHNRPFMNTRQAHPEAIHPEAFNPANVHNPQHPNVPGDWDPNKHRPPSPSQPSPTSDTPGVPKGANVQKIQMRKVPSSLDLEVPKLAVATSPEAPETTVQPNLSEKKRRAGLLWENTKPGSAQNMKVILAGIYGSIMTCLVMWMVQRVRGKRTVDTKTDINA